MIIQRLFSSKAQKARRRKFDVDQAMKQGKQTEALSQAKMLGKDKTNDILNKYTKNTKTTREGAFLVTRTTVKNKKELDEMVRARNLVKEGRKMARSEKDWTQEGYGVDDHINDKAQDRTHKHKLEYRKALKKKISEKSKEQTKKNLKKGGKIALATGGAIAAGIGAKKLADKKKAKKDDNSEK